MAAFGAAVSLLNTLLQLQNDPKYPYAQITALLEGVNSLKSFLVDNKEVKREFEIQIRDAIYEAQDVIDSHLSSTHFLSPSEAEISIESFCGDLERSLQKVNLIAKMATSKEFTHQTLDRKISNLVWKDLDEIEALNPHHVVGREEDFNRIGYWLGSGSAGLEVVSIVGIAGMGKTAFAKCIFEDKEIDKHFGIRAWVKVPIEYNKRVVLLGLLRSMKKLGDGIHHMTDDQLARHLYNSLKRKRYLVVLDDIRDVAVWNDLKEVLPNYYNESRILVTTRHVDIARVVGTPHLLDRVSDEDTFVLLQEIVFGEEPCPPELYVIAKDIANSCIGLPQAVMIVGKLLRCAKLIPYYWELVLSSINACENYVDLTETLVSLTYKHMPSQLKPCLLYMAMFPYEYNIYLFKLMDLWIAEGFIPTHNMYTSSKGEMDIALACFAQLYARDLISYIVEIENEKEAVEITDEVFHDFFTRTAKEEKFFLIISKDMDLEDSLLEENNTYNQKRRLFISKNIIPFVIHNIGTNTSFSTASSLLYYGPEPQYRLNAWLDFKLLRVLDILKVCFYSFPLEILKLIQLRYLALSYNRQLPAAVCMLQNLQFLIVIRHQRVKQRYGAPSYLPVEIWNMKELRHLQVVGSDLPNIPSDTDLHLENLLKLSGVSSHSCTRQILGRIPNLLDLRIQIESLPEDESLSFFSHLHILNKLHVFKCVVMYPSIGSQAVPSCIPSFPCTLIDLTLEGCGFPWEYMSAIAALPILRNLRLQNYAFQGPDWEVKKGEFPNLDYLVLEDMNLKNWTFADQSCFPKMIHFIIRHCYKLQEIPFAIGDIPTLTILEMVDCSTSAMNSALKIKEDKRSRGDDSVRFDLYSIHDD